MEGKQKPGIRLWVIGVVVLIIGIGGYFLNTFHRSDQAFKSEDSLSILTILSPGNGETVAGEELFEAKLQTKKDMKVLKAVLKLGDGPNLPLNLKKLQNSDIILSSYYDLSQIPSGQHDIRAYVYDTSNGLNTIATAEVSVIVKNP